MIEYYPGYIFHDDDDYPEVAAWCNANGCYIKEITPDNDGRRFEIMEIPQKDLDTAKADKIAELNAAKNHQLDTGGLEYEEDLFAYDDKALLRISGTILDWQDQISRGTVQPEDIVQQTFKAGSTENCLLWHIPGKVSPGCYYTCGT